MTDNDKSAEEENALPNALAGDTRRRASPIVRGFLYQFWQTVEAWLDLAPEELLYVEGAEDFDVVEDDKGTAVQIKDNKASGPVTLTTSGAQSAIRNYWNLRQNNPGRRLSFKFLTTAAAGIETPGFDGSKGTDIWNLCRRSALESCVPEVERIREFLLKKTSLGGGLLEFIKTASAEQLKADLIDPIEWIYDQPELQGIEEIVTARLLGLGESRGLTVNDATRLAGQLCLEVARGATEDRPKCVGFADLRRRLDQAVNVEVPREAIRDRERRANAMIETLLASQPVTNQLLPAITSASETFARPILTSNSWPRPALIERLRHSMRTGIVYLSGGTGIGKTTLVLQALEHEKTVFWAALRDRTTSEQLYKWRVLRQRVARIFGAYVVLDDWNPADDPRNFEHELGWIAAVVRKQTGVLIITSYGDAGPRLATVLGLTSDNVINVPPFDEDEVQAYLRDAGCPEIRAKTLSRVVWVHTSGHPQLVAARVSTLKAKDFPKPIADDFLDQPKDVADVQAEARTIVRAMPDDARSLLYRLSIPLPPLRRAHILGVAASDPAITFAGEIFDTVVGPWFQQVALGYYRISPLLSKAGEQVLSREEIKRLHADIASALLAERALTPSELSAVFMHALLGEAEGTLAIAANAFIRAPRGVKKMLAEELPWVPAAGLSPGARLPISNKTVLQMFRLVQWDVAALIAPRHLKSITAAMDEEFAGTTELVEILPRILYLSKLLMQQDFKVSIVNVISHTLEVKRLSSIAREKNPSVVFGDEVPPLYPSAPRPELAELFTVAIIPRVRAVADMRALIDALDLVPEEHRNWLLAGLAVEDGELRIFFNSTWLSIPKDNKNRFEEYEQVLAYAIDAARRWRNPAWMRAAARTRSAVLDEMLDRPSDAEKTIEAVAREVGMSSNLEDQLAVIAFNRKDYPAALAIWQRVLPQWRSDETFHDLQPVFGLRCAAIAASQLGRWPEAADFYEQAILRGGQFDKPGWNIGLPTDCAYAWWKAGDTKAALQLLTEVVAKLQTLPNVPDSFEEYAVQKLVGHTLSELASPGSVAEYVPGMCSDLSPNKEIGSLQPIPTIITWFLLHDLARQAGDKGLAYTCSERMTDAPFAFLRATAAQDEVDRAIESDNLSAVPNLAAVFGIEMEKSAKRKKEQIDIYAPDPEALAADLTASSMNVFVCPALWSAVLRSKALGEGVRGLIERWHTTVDQRHGPLVAEMAFIEQFAGTSATQLGLILKDQKESAERRMWAAVFLVGNDDAPLLDAVYAHVTAISNGATYKTLWNVGGPSVDELVRRDWRRFCEATFLLRNPRLHVNSIRAACNADGRSWHGAANVVLAGLPTTSLRLSDEVGVTLHQIAANADGGMPPRRR
jgi:tetratricopeptide (TPR) repeat protein